MQGQDVDTKTVVSAADFVRNFGQWRDLGAQRPVFITHHNRESHVLLSISQYREHSTHGDAFAEGGPVLPIDYFSAFAHWLNDGLILCDRSGEIVALNHAAYGICDLPPVMNFHGRLRDVLPAMAQSVIDVQFQRTVRTGEGSSADIPSPFRPENWLHVRTFPIQNFIGILLNDITEDVSRHRLADSKVAMAEAFDAHGGIAYIRVSARGFIDCVNGPFTALIGLSEEKLRNVAFCDLVVPRMKPRLRELLEEVMRGEGQRQTHVQLLSNLGSAIDVTVAISQLRGAYGAEGAVIILTLDNPAGQAVPAAGDA